MTTVRRVLPAQDAAAVAEVSVAAWRVAYAGVMPQEYLDARDPARLAEGMRRVWEDPDGTERVLVAEQAGGSSAPSTAPTGTRRPRSASPSASWSR